MKKLIALLLCAVIMTACGSQSTENTSDPGTSESAGEETNESEGEEAEEPDQIAENLGTQENPAVARDGVTIVDPYAGSYEFKLLNVYKGEDALSKLTDMGQTSFSSEDMMMEDNYQYVLMEYDLTALDGYDEEKLYGDAVQGNDMWNAEYTSKYHYYGFELYENAGLDYCHVVLSTGESSKVYYLYQLPIDLEVFYSKILLVDESEYWVRYDL